MLRATKSRRVSPSRCATAGAVDHHCCVAAVLVRADGYLDIVARKGHRVGEVLDLRPRHVFVDIDDREVIGQALIEKRVSVRDADGTGADEDDLVSLRNGHGRGPFVVGWVANGFYALERSYVREAV